MKSIAFTKQLATASALALCALAFLLPGAAHADVTVCTAGSGPGQCQNPTGVATDTAGKRAYVADRGNHEIDVFEVKEGEGKVEFLFSFGAAQLASPRRVAVDNDPLSPAYHDVYVFDADTSNFPVSLRLKRFHPDGSLVKETAAGEFSDPGDMIATGPGGEVYVGDIVNFDEKTVLKKFDAELEPAGQCELPHKDRLSEGLAVDSSGNAYAAFNKGGGVYKFGWAEPQCSEAGAPFPLTLGVGTSAVAVDGSGQIYAAQGLAGANPAAGFRVITKFSAAGTIQRRYGFGFAATTVPGLAPLLTSLGDVFGAEEESTGSGGKVVYLKEPPPGPLVASLSTPIPVGNVRTTLEAEINPEGEAGTEYHFEYVDDAHFQSEGGFASPATKTTSTTALPGLADFELKEHLASAQIGCPDPLVEAKEPGSKCLQPEMLYHYRVLASNPDGSGNSPVAGTFETEKYLEIEDVYASEVGTDSARLNAIVNPLGIPTSGWFEYVTEAQFQASGFAEATQVPDVGGGAGELDFDAGNGAVRRSALVELKPGTAYRLRFIADDPLLDDPVASEEIAVFKTFLPEEEEACPGNAAFRQGPGALLPDCRAYELVTPLDKEGGDIRSLGSAAEALTQSSPAGDKLAYGSYRAFGDAQAAPLTTQYVAARTKEGWSSHFILPPRERLNVGISEALFNELRWLSPDLCEGWIKTQAEPPLAPGAHAGQLNLYRRTDGECEASGEASYEVLTRAKPAHGAFVTLELQGVAQSGAGAVYLARDNLEGTKAPNLGGEEFALYYQAVGASAPRYVCFGTDGKPTATGCSAGTLRKDGAGYVNSASLGGAISADGQRVFFSAPSTYPGGGEAPIYLRERPGAEQSKVVAGNCTEAARACTIAVSAKGEELTGGAGGSQFWTAAKDGSAVLYSTGSNPAATDLYRFDVATKATTLIAHKALGVMGAGEDLTRVYFASREALAGSGPNPEGAEPTAGKANLYLLEAGTVRFVAELAESDVGTAVLNTAVNPRPLGRRARVSDDGSVAVFMSAGSPTGYDNRDAESGEADSEVFRYAAAGGGSLACVSCNPSGGRPSGALIPQALANKFWAAATIPGWKTSLHPGRLMSADGNRVYFEAVDALAPRDTNGKVDVYQWEAPGTGSCEEGDPVYSEQNEGCVSLISSGQSGDNARLLEAGASGEDVFFTTVAGLVPWDRDQVDAYDARVGGGLPAPPEAPPECEAEACQNPPPAPEPAAPGSLRFEGPGNAAQARQARKCGKAKRKRKGRCVKRKAQRRQGRGAIERRAGSR